MNTAALLLWTLCIAAALSHSRREKPIYPRHRNPIVRFFSLFTHRFPHHDVILFYTILVLPASLVMGAVLTIDLGFTFSSANVFLLLSALVFLALSSLWRLRSTLRARPPAQSVAKAMPGAFILHPLWSAVSAIASILGIVSFYLDHLF